MEENRKSETKNRRKKKKRKAEIFEDEMNLSLQYSSTDLFHNSEENVNKKESIVHNLKFMKSIGSIQQLTMMMMIIYHMNIGMSIMLFGLFRKNIT